MGEKFYKMVGSGNDFVMLDGRESRLEDWPSERISRVCDRRYGVGADGMILLEPLKPGAVRMHYFNSDGGRAALCGNGSLCSTTLSLRLGFVDSNLKLDLHTDAGLLRTRADSDGLGGELNFPDFPVPVRVAIAAQGGETGRAWLADIGVPHLVVEVTDLTQVDVANRGRELRFDKKFGPAGTNVNFVSPLSHDPGATWSVRTYERGVEGETLACGTGTVCAAFSLASESARLPLCFKTTGGGTLEVAGSILAGNCRGVWLRGEGRLVYTGELAE